MALPITGIDQFVSKERVIDMKAKTLATALWSLSLVSVLASAEKPDHAGKDRSNFDDRRELQERDKDRMQHYGSGGSISFTFDDAQRRLIHDYYYGQISQGNCPPGLAKKGNGCQAPGQVKQWHKGKPLAKGVIYYDLPYDLMRRLPPPPYNHRYVQVAGDILLIAIGTGIVVDALENILH